MNLLNPLLQNKSQSSHLYLSPFTSRCPTKTPQSFRIPSSKFRKNPLSPAYLLPFSSRLLLVSARCFGGPTTRRNYLRKKVVGGQQVPLEKHVPLDTAGSDLRNPGQGFNGVSDSIENLGALDEDGDSGAGVIRYAPGGSASSRKLESWLDQYNKDVACWGIGSNPIFTAFEDLDGNVKRVVVDEDEILRRSSEGEHELDSSTGVSSKILYAKGLTRDMESGSIVIPRNSSVVKFVDFEESRGVNAVHSVVNRPDFIPMLSGVGKLIFCSIVAIWAAKKLLNFGGEKKLTKLEKEMMRRKKRSRKEKETLQMGSVEVVQEQSELSAATFEGPKIDKDELMKFLLEANVSMSDLTSKDASSLTNDSDWEIVDIQVTGGQSAQMESRRHSLGNNNGVENNIVNETASSEIQDVKEHPKVVAETVAVPNDYQKFDSVQRSNIFQTKNRTFPDTPTGCGNSVSKDLPVSVVSETKDLNGESVEIKATAGHSGGAESRGQSLSCDNELGNYKKNEMIQDVKEQAIDIEVTAVSVDRPDVHEAKDEPLPDTPTAATGFRGGDLVPFKDHMSLRASTGMPDALGDAQTKLEDGVIQSSDIPTGNEYTSDFRLVRKKARVILSVKEAREFLAKKTKKDSRASRKGVTKRKTKVPLPGDRTPGTKTGQGVEMNINLHRPSLTPNEASKSFLVPSTCEDSGPKNLQSAVGGNDGYIDSEGGQEVHDVKKCNVPLNDHIVGTKSLASKNTESWVEKNFHEVEPVFKKIGDGFRENYTVAMGKANELESTDNGAREFNFNDDDSEFEWMRDDSLREIVFQVRENELAGKDPFYLMDANDKLKFFEGLKKKVEQENEKLYQVHEYLHANIENLDYGADGISIYDPPEKIIPRWKGPPIVKSPEFINNSQELRNSVLSANGKTSLDMKKDGQRLVQKTTEFQINEEIAAAHPDSGWKRSSPVKDQKNSNTIIEGSDGSVKTGKKSGKEYWQHTKKWTREFLEAYNAETDPDVKATMKDLGKGLDRWITEEEVQEAAELRDKMRERIKPFMEKKINKLKREMELFGAQAVASKYREYAEEEEEDYLWWLDLPHVLCIELYTIENGEHKVGMYSLEMAADLELESKPCHVIAFEDAGDCKHLCYIIQAHMEMLGNGNAFVVAMPPKDAFREAKANNFSVTVIRKGELELNIDQPLEEVEEQITEIGSKMYHDKITRERSVDISGLMKGVFGISEPTARTSRKRKRLKRKLEKPSKP